MEIKSPDELYSVLMVLKDAGVSRARIDGLGEFSFEQPAPQVTAPVTFVEAPRAAPVPFQVGDAPNPGYAALFNGQPPKFKPAAE